MRRSAETSGSSFLAGLSGPSGEGVTCKRWSFSTWVAWDSGPGSSKSHKVNVTIVAIRKTAIETAAMRPVLVT